MVLPAGRFPAESAERVLDERDDETGRRGRECDRLARAVLGSRFASVFTPPARQAAHEAADGGAHGTVSETNREIVGEGLSIQAHHIAPGIAEVDAFLAPDDEDERRRRRDRVREAHPEVCFAALAGGPLEYSKTSAVGLEERLAALETVVNDPDSVFRAVCRDLARGSDGRDVTSIDPDDVLAVSATADDGTRRTLPESPPTDVRGLPMEMVYRSDAPFEID